MSQSIRFSTGIALQFLQVRSQAGASKGRKSAFSSCRLRYCCLLAPSNCVPLPTNRRPPCGLRTRACFRRPVAACVSRRQSSASPANLLTLPTQMSSIFISDMVPPMARRPTPKAKCRSRTSSSVQPGALLSASAPRLTLRQGRFNPSPRPVADIGNLARISSAPSAGGTVRFRSPAWSVSRVVPQLAPVSAVLMDCFLA